MFGEIWFVFAVIFNDPAGELVHHLRHIVVVSELRAVHKLREIGIHRGSERCVVGDFGLALLSFLGGDDNHTA